MSRAARERAILEIIDGEAIGTQDALVGALATRGIVASQGTVSRDIQRLRLVKVPVPAGGHRYAPPGAELDGPSRFADTALRDAAQAVTGLGEGTALLVVKTLTGRATQVALAIDEARLPGVVGTVAGDDTVIVVLQDAAARSDLRAVLERAME
jgi:transcriptional regulator of arginine metabolism